MEEKYSGKRVIRAGEALIKDETFENEESLSAHLKVLSYWRFSHENALQNALTELTDVVRKRDSKAIFAKRLKRYISIVNKLRRFPDMKLKNMQDIGGCRAIVSNSKKLEQVARDLRKKPRYRRKGRIRFKDYVNKPKADGYRGYHIIGGFGNGAGEERNIEIQLRTRLQHDWATTLEIVDLFTGQALKTNQGRPDWHEFFREISVQFALMEEIPIFDKLSFDKKRESYQNKMNQVDLSLKSSCLRVQQLAESLRVERKLEAYSNSLKVVDTRFGDAGIDGYALVIVDTQKATVKSRLFTKDDNEKAEEEYSKIEREFAKNEEVVVALVSTTAVGGIKEAYPNYFADSSHFIQHLVCVREAKVKVKTSFIERMLVKSGL